MNTRFDRSRLSRSGKKSGKNTMLFFVIGVIILGFFSISVAGTGSILISPGTYTLPKGATISTLPEDLKLSISPWKYKLWLRFFAPKAPALQAGIYQVTKSVTLEEAFGTVFIHPTSLDQTITILPGWNIYDIDATLSAKGIIKTGAIVMAARDNFPDFQKKYSFLRWVTSLEGFLYPDTYRITQNATAKDILDRLLAEFSQKIGSDYTKLGTNAYMTLILASIVEREERNNSEKPTVAGILQKRVKEGIPMGADATVCYASAKTQKQCTPEFIASIIHEKSPYNTRNKQGYTPTPISNPSLETWKAAYTPMSSDYYYYLHDANGKIHYAKTLEEHTANKNLFLK